MDARDPHFARQNPADYVAGLERSVRGAIAAATASDSGFSAAQVVGIGVDTTGSSPIPVDCHNVPLALHERWRNEPAAQCWLWKDHTSYAEAAEITALAREMRPAYLAKCGGTYSSEWFWSKILRCLRAFPEVFEAAWSWVELCDWVPSLLVGVADPAGIKRGVCAAGHKAMYCEEWGGLPDAAFLGRLAPGLAALRDRLYTRAHDASEAAGALCTEWAVRLGLPEDIPVAMGAFDVHYGAIGCGIEPGVLVKVIGTSTCDCAVADPAVPVPDIPGICGMVKGAILPGMLGIEAGQSAVGDIFKWWIEGVCAGGDAEYAALEAEAAAFAPCETGLLALDWNNGNRTILVDPQLTGLVLGLTLRTTRAAVYRGLIEATAFGARMILERLVEYGVKADRIVCAGGIAAKNPLLMQIYADVTGCTMQVAGSPQACALGSALVAGVLAGAHGSFAEAQSAMTRVKPVEYRPDPDRKAAYDQLFAIYRRLHDAFGGVAAGADLGSAMKDLLKLQQQARNL